MPDGKVIKRIIILIIALALLCAGAYGAFAAFRYMRVSTPLSHIRDGFQEGDSRELLSAFPPFFASKLTDRDYDGLDEELNDFLDGFDHGFVKSKDYKLKFSVLGQKKASKKTADQLRRFYDMLGEFGIEADQEIKDIYYTDVKFSLKSAEDDISLTIGIYIGKIEGKWYIVGADDLFNSVLVPSLLGYVRKSNLRTANINAKLVYTTVNGACADLISDGREDKIVTGDVGPVAVIDLDLSDPIQSEVYRAFDQDTDGALGYVYYRIDSDGRIQFAQWRENDKSVIGQYPYPAADIDESMKLEFGNGGKPPVLSDEPEPDKPGVPDEPDPEPTGRTESQKQLRIYTWNNEFKNRLREFYDQYDKDRSGWTGEKDYAGDWVVGQHEYLKNGTEIVWVTVDAYENAYQNKLDSDLADQAENNLKIDMFLIEADYAQKYINSPYAVPIRNIGLSDNDLKDQYQYTKDIVTDKNGVLRAVAWQATPGVFVYKRDIARNVLGTDDPSRVQAAISDWDKFNAVAARMKEKGYFMLSGHEDSYRVFFNNRSMPWVNGNNEIVIDENLWKWVDQTKEFADKGYSNGTNLWDNEWDHDQTADGKVFGFFLSTWGVDFTLKYKVEQNDLYYVCEAPQAFYWGGSWLCAATGTDNPDIVRDIMYKMTCDNKTMGMMTDRTLEFSNNQTAMKDLANGFSSEFLGGQNHMAVYAEAARKIDASKTSPYDTVCNDEFIKAFYRYFTGEISWAEALDDFYNHVIERHPELRRPR